jgi:hypothetical protein
VVVEALEFVADPESDSDTLSAQNSGPWPSLNKPSSDSSGTRSGAGSYSHGARHEASSRVTMRGFVDLVSVTMLGDGIGLSDAPHRRLAHLRETGGTVSSEHVSTWYMAVHHTTFGSLNVNCTAQLVPGSARYAAREPVWVQPMARGDPQS